MARIFWLLALLLFCLRLLGQETTFGGKVLDERGEAVTAANIFLRGSYDGASSDEEGRFSFSTALEGEQTLVVSYLGYLDWESSFVLTGQTLELEIRLQAAANELEGVVITAGAFEAGDQRKSVMLRPLDIATTAGATADIAGVINTLPGTQTVGEEGRIFVRGGAAYETRTLIDGLYVQNPYNGSVPDVPARNRFSPFLFQGTMFSTGGYSAEYGQALSSALILQTQDLSPQTSSSISLLSVGMSLSHTRRWEKTSLALAADYSNLAPYMGLINQQIDWRKAPESSGGQLIFRHQTSVTGMLKVQAGAQRSRMAMAYPDPGDLSRKNPLSLAEDNGYLQATFQECLGEKWILFSGAALNFNEQNIQERFSLHDQEQSAQARIRMTYLPGEALQLRFGVEYLLTRFRETYIDPDRQTFNPRFNDHYTAAFAEADLHFSKRWVARLGNRAEYSSLSASANWAPRLSMAYKTGDHAQVSLAYGHFFQTPETDLLRFRQDLGFERATHYIANFQWEKEARVFRVEAYYKAYRDLVRFPGGRPWESDNSGEGYAQGLDFFFRDRRSIKNVDYWISYSLLDTRRLHRDFPTRATPHFASRHNLSLVYKQWIPFLSMSMGATYSLASSRPYHDPNSEAFLSARTPAFQDLSANFSYLTRLFGQFTIVHASVTNIPGFRQTFGYRFSTNPDDNGQFNSMPIEPPARRFLFLGVFITFGGEEIII